MTDQNENRIPLTDGDDLISRMERLMGCRYEENDMNNPTVTALKGMTKRVEEGDDPNPESDDYLRGIIIEEDRDRGPVDFLTLAFAMM